jgi:DNA repair protein RadD
MVGSATRSVTEGQCSGVDDTMILRSYQTAMLDEAREHMRSGKRRVLLVAPTGAGKRLMAVQAIQTAVERGKRCCFLVHRQELLDQSSATLTEAGVAHGIIKAGVRPDDALLCQVASVMTLIKREVAPFDFVFADESHHCPATTWSQVVEAQPNAFILGFTATPHRLDSRGLARQFDAMVVGPGMRELIDQGYLADYRLYAPPPPDLTGVHTVAGEYDRGELAAAMDRPQIVGDVVEHYSKYAPHTQAILFASSIAHSMHFAEAFRTQGIKAQHADGETPREQRRQILKDFEAGKFQVLCNVDLLSEGLDVAGIEAVICARPTKSLTVYLQQIGRGLRVKPSGQRAVLLDHAGNYKRHGLPDQDREWVLTDDKVKHAAAEVEVTECRVCFMVLPATTQVCPGCGAVLREEETTGEGVGRGLEHVEGELVAIDTQAIRAERKRAEGRARSLQELVALAESRGYRYPQGWAKHVVAGRERRRA